jgi:hypothetical protein
MKKELTIRDIYTLLANFRGEFQEFQRDMYDFKNQVNTRFREVSVRFDNLEERVFPRVLDCEDLGARVSYIEKKLRIKSR